MSRDSQFGPELRRLRQEAGLTLTEFSVALNYDMGYGDDLKPFLGHWNPYGPRSY